MAKIRWNRGEPTGTVNEPGKPSTVSVNVPEPPEEINFIVDSSGNLIADNEENNLIDG